MKAWESKTLDMGIADRMIENVIGTYSLPIGVATNFIIIRTLYVCGGRGECGHPSRLNMAKKGVSRAVASDQANDDQ